MPKTTPRLLWKRDHVTRTRELLSISGTPEECLAKLQRDILPTGINHIVAGVVDTHLLKVLADRTVPNGVDAATQLQLIHDRVMPHLEAVAV